jgi:hypothetical protein
VLPFFRLGRRPGGGAVLLAGRRWRSRRRCRRRARRVFAWRWSGDWITEWPDYAVGFGIAGVANAVLAYMLTSTPVPVYASFAAMMAAAFVAGCLVAGHLGGMRVLPEQREQRQRAAARRR